ncbi:MAG TPA: hypothetical protein VGH73_09705 [Thermoanaerobaculia bacterium]|jgi:hypothetical protein
MARDLSRTPLTALLCGLLVLSLGGLAAPARAASSWLPQGEEFPVNAHTHLDQFHPGVAIFQGNAFVAWTDAALGRIYGRLIGASGFPLTDDFRIDQGSPAGGPDAGAATRARVVSDGSSQIAVVWAPLSGGVRLSLFNAVAQPLSSPAAIYDEPSETIGSPDVAFDGSGGLVAAWVSTAGADARVLAQPLDSLGRPVSGAFPINQTLSGPRRGSRVAVDPASGNFLVTWIDERETGNPDVWARFFSAARQPLGPELRVNSDKVGETFAAVPVAHAGVFSVVWNNQGLGADTLDVLAQRFDATGHRTGPEVLLSPDATDGASPAVTVDPASGRLLVLWVGSDGVNTDGGISGRFFTPSWAPAGDSFLVNATTARDQTEPAVSADPAGGFAAVWSSGAKPDPAAPLADRPGQDGSAYGIFGQRFDAPTGCFADADRLCLGGGSGGGRFEVRATWRNPYTGETGTAHSHPLAADTGALWFFDAGNLELMIKVLDGRSVNGHYWVFYGALSNVEYTLTVTDTATGAVRTYHNPPLQLASQADVSAFADAAPATRAAAPPEPILPVPSSAGIDATAAQAAAGCSPSSTALCLAAGRFAVSVVWTDPRIGVPAQAQAVPLTADTGAFWFLDATNLELMIKVLDGRAVNGHFWVFYGALSDLEYTITVTDTATGSRRTYHNDRHTLASQGDTVAF